MAKNNRDVETLLPYDHVVWVRVAHHDGYFDVCALFFGSCVGNCYPDTSGLEYIIPGLLGRAAVQRVINRSLIELADVCSKLPEWATVAIRSRLEEKLNMLEKEALVLQADLNQANQFHNHITAALDQIR